MTTLTIFNHDRPEQPLLRTEDVAEIRQQLAEQGIRFEQWPTRELADDASSEAILEAYRYELARLKQ